MAEGRMATFPIDQTPAQSSIIGQRINNPYNIRQYDQGFLGESGEDSGFISFEDPMYGVRAADKVLTTYGTKRGINTVRGLINRFAPPPSENDTSSYVNYISGQLGIDPDAEVDLSDPEMRARILSPMAMMESRSEYSPGQITGMIEQANLSQGDSGSNTVPRPNTNSSARNALTSRFRRSCNHRVDEPSRAGSRPPLPEGLVEGMLTNLGLTELQRSLKQTAEG